LRVCISVLIHDLVHQRENHEVVPQRSLFSFRGNRRAHSVRRKLFELYGTFPEASLVDVSTKFHAHTPEQKAAFITDVLASKFVLCPRGAGPATYRLFEVMSLGRCPVIISDDWVPIKGIDWSKCSVFVREREIAQIPSMLRNRKLDPEELGQNARAMWEKHFADRPKFRHMFDCGMSIHSNLRRAFFDYRARWNSWRFYRSNGWLLYQRLGARALRIAAAS
jgi:hypothetical protein